MPEHPPRTPTIADLRRHRGKSPEESALERVKENEQRESTRDMANRLILFSRLLEQKQQEMRELEMREAMLGFAFHARLRDLVKEGRESEAIALARQLPENLLRLESDCSIALELAKEGNPEEGMRVLKKFVKTSGLPEAAGLYERVSRIIEEDYLPKEKKAA